MVQESASSTSQSVALQWWSMRSSVTLAGFGTFPEMRGLGNAVLFNWPTRFVSTPTLDQRQVYSASRSIALYSVIEDQTEPRHITQEGGTRLKFCQAISRSVFRFCPLRCCLQLLMHDYGYRRREQTDASSGEDCGLTLSSFVQQSRWGTLAS